VPLQENVKKGGTWRLISGIYATIAGVFGVRRLAAAFVICFLKL
jgi:hypothetical protein